MNRLLLILATMLVLFVIPLGRLAPVDPGLLIVGGLWYSAYWNWLVRAERKIR